MRKFVSAWTNGCASLSAAASPVEPVHVAAFISNALPSVLTGAAMAKYLCPAYAFVVVPPTAGEDVLGEVAAGTLDAGACVVCVTVFVDDPQPEITTALIPMAVSIFPR